jgi:hypothetical protein
VHRMAFGRPFKGPTSPKFFIERHSGPFSPKRATEIVMNASGQSSVPLASAIADSVGAYTCVIDVWRICTAPMLLRVPEWRTQY